MFGTATFVRILTSQLRIKVVVIKSVHLWSISNFLYYTEELDQDQFLKVLLLFVFKRVEWTRY